MFDYGDNCPLTGMCYDYYLLKPIIDYYNAWCTYPEDFSLEDLMRQCYDNFFKSWHEEYEYWADNEDAIREELHHNQYEDRLYYENGDVYVEPLNEGYEKWRRTMGKEVKIDVGYKDVLEKSLSAIQYLRIHGFSTYMESEGIVNRIMMFKDKNEMRDQKIRSI